jgi:hypothetical protein
MEEGMEERNELPKVDSKMEYTYRGKRYEILSQITNKDGDTLRAEQLLRDFLHCEEVRDWGTIKNRITNGLKWGWLKEISFKEEMDTL